MQSFHSSKKVGFLVNPIAGMGGSVGLKGTDGLAQKARLLGAEPMAPKRAMACLELIALSQDAGDIQFLTASGDMGEDELKASGLDFTVVCQAPESSSSKDTKAACEAFLSHGADLILFCGGDGTARDVASSAGDTPVLGIPAGVKMHSGVFAICPQAAAELAIGYLKGGLNMRETEIVDVDEDLYRQGELQTRLYCLARTPYRPAFVQERKQIYSSNSEEEFKDQIAVFAREFMRDGSAYILGAGTTTGRITEVMGIEKTLLGVDVVRDEKLILKDASEKDLLELLERIGKARIVISPIGAQGFILGRGSQQISPEVIRNAGIEGLIIISTPHKLSEVPYLLVDTGDPKLDKALSGRRRVVTGYRLAQVKEVRAASQVPGQES